MTQHTTHSKPANTGIKRIIKATGYSIKGLISAFKSEAAIRQELLLLAIFAPIALYLDLSVVEKILLIGVLVNVLIVELLNSAIEAIVDRVGTDYHELSGKAKDIGSAAVFISLMFAGCTWFGVLYLS